MNDFNLISAQEMIMTACTNIELAEMERNNNLLKSWKYVVSSIKSNAVNGENLGMNLYTHSRIIDLKNNILLVETDHPGWIQYLKMYQKYILNGLKLNLPDLKITHLAFRVAGEKVSLSESYENQLKKERKEMEAKIDRQEKELAKYKKDDNQHKVTSELPPELLAKFDSIRQSMLTNSDNK
jgi:hypothetical protein